MNYFIGLILTSFFVFVFSGRLGEFEKVTDFVTYNDSRIVPKAKFLDEVRVKHLQVGQVDGLSIPKDIADEYVLKSRDQELLFTLPLDGATIREFRFPTKYFLLKMCYNLTFR